MDAPTESLSPAERAGNARDALLAAAAASERRNRPVYLVVIASLLLVACIISLAWSLWTRGRAAAEFERQSAAATSLAQAVGRLKDLEAAAASGGGLGAAPLEKIRSLLRDAAERAGVPGAQSILPRVQPEARQGGVQRVKLEYDRVTSVDLDPLLLWMRYAADDIPGLEVYSVSLRPETNQWVMKVVFTRWERTGS